MKKFFVVALASLFVCSAVDAQILRADELESYAWRKRSIPTHSEWLYPLTFDAGKGLKEA